MNATLLPVILLSGRVATIALPMPDIAVCRAWLARPEPIVVSGLQALEATCIDRPTDPGKPT